MIAAVKRSLAAVLVMVMSVMGVMATVAVVSAQTMQVTPLAKDGRILVTLRMNDVFTEDVRAAMHSGMRITFIYDVELKRSTALWVDRTLAMATVTATIEYSILTRRYMATRREDGRMERAEPLEREEEARAWLTEFEKLPLFSTAALEGNSRVLLARARPHDSAKRLLRVAVGRWHRGVRQVHVSPVAC